MGNVATGMKRNARFAGCHFPVLPEITVLAAEMLVHGIKGTHTTVLLQPDPI